MARGFSCLSAVLAAVVSCAAQAPERPPPAAAPPAVAIPEPAPAPPAPKSVSPAACSDSEDASFESVWPQLRAHLEAGIQGLAPLVDPARGVFVLDNPGAFVVPMHFASIAEVSERVPALGPDNYRLKCPELRTDATPHYSCETEQWSTQGCVLTPNPDFSVARWYELALQYEILPAKEANRDLPRAREADASISHGVYSTDATFGFYFGRVGCGWRLLAIDAVTPCSA